MPRPLCLAPPQPPLSVWRSDRVGGARAARMGVAKGSASPPRHGLFLVIRSPQLALLRAFFCTTTAPLLFHALRKEPVKTLAMRQKIYCSGSLLEAVQSARLFPDSKHFVDMPLKRDCATTLIRWEELRASLPTLSSDSISAFLQEHFEEPGTELQPCLPVDFVEHVDTFNRVTDLSYRAWAQALHRKWPSLCRQISPHVLAEPERYSLLCVPHPFIVPGGRFREMYYWDSFFTIKGLIASGMTATAHGMVLNMAHLIEEFGFVPNGNRVYYLNRSQPPLLTWCVYALFKATDDIQLVQQLLPTLRKELSFFYAHRRISVPGCAQPLFHYRVAADGPRPESFREDVETAEYIADECEKRRLWGDIAAAAESGRDFSSRWFSQNGEHGGNLRSTRTSAVIPVDLNAIIAGNLRLLSELYSAVGNDEESAWADAEFAALKGAIHQVLWNEEHACWFDYDLSEQRQITVYCDTNLFPLGARCAHDDLDSSRISAYLSTAGALSFPGGLPSSLVASGEQWDFPNAWAPTTWIVVDGLMAIGECATATAIAEKYLRTNFSIWSNSGGQMFEKCSVETATVAGGGGEYDVQEGFAWTNGVCLDFLLSFGDRLVSPSAPPADSPVAMALPIPQLVPPVH